MKHGNFFLLLYMYSQNTFCADNLSTTANLTCISPPTCRPQRNRQCLDRALRFVMIIVPILAAHVHRNARSRSKALQRMWDQLRAQRADTLASQAKINDCVRPGRDIHDGPRKRLVQGRVAATEPDKRDTAAQCFLEGGAEREKSVFCRVVVVDCGYDTMRD